VKYLVTGAAGFIGSNLSARLVNSGHEVLGVDNYSPYYSPDLKHLRVAQLLSPLGVKVIDSDLSDLNRTQELVHNFSPDTIIHLAAQPGVRTPLGKSYQYIQNNLVGYANILQSAVIENTPNFLYASSSSVYGNSTNVPYEESDTSIRPISIYGATKLANEMLTPSYIQGSKTKCRGMRFFTVYGPWGRPDMAYFRVINSVLNGGEFKKFGDGSIKRDFTYVEDITASIELLSQELIQRATGYSDIVNIGGGNPYSLNDLIQVIEQQTGIVAKILLSDGNPNDTTYTRADVNLLKELTGFTPKVNLSEGVTATIEWAKNTKILKSLPAWIASTN
jgi:UDP-glucuronate 4-epimerase